MIDTAKPTPPIWHIPQRIDPTELALFRSGPAELIAQRIEKFIATMPALEQESQYGRFVTLAKKHGVRLTLIIAVDMPPEKA